MPCSARRGARRLDLVSTERGRCKEYRCTGFAVMIHTCASPVLCQEKGDHVQSSPVSIAVGCSDTDQDDFLISFAMLRARL